MQNHVLQTFVTLPRKSGFDPRVAKTSEAQRSFGGDGKLYMMADQHDQKRFHILSEAELEDEKRRSIEIKDALVKSVGRSRPSSTSSSSAASRYSTNKLSQSPAPSPVKSSQHSPSSSSRYSTSSATTKSTATTTAAVDHPSIRKSIEAPTGIAERSQIDPITATSAGLDSLKTQYEENLNVIDQLYKDKTSLEHRVKSLEFQREHPHSRAMIPGAEDLRPANVHVIKSSSSAGAGALSSSFSEGNKTTTASSPSSSRGRPTGSIPSDTTRRSREKSPIATVMDALQFKHEQNLQVIEKLTEEKQLLESKARNLALVIVNGEPKDLPSPHYHNLHMNSGQKFGVEGHDLEGDEDGGDDGDGTHQPASEEKNDSQHKTTRPQSAPTRISLRTHSLSPGTSLRIDQSFNIYTSLSSQEILLTTVW